MSTGEVCTCGDGRTVEFRGTGLDSEYRICPQVDRLGHLTMMEVREKIRLVRNAHAPSSGRFA